MKESRLAMLGEAALEEIIDRYEGEKGFSGSFLVEAMGRELLSGARGFAHRGFAVPNKVDTRFDTASVTKIFTAAAAFRMADRGLVGLDERVRDIVDLGDSPIPREVTLRHCLTHSSGIADDADEESGEDYEDIWKEKPCYAVRTTGDFLPQFVHKEPLFAPGNGCRYNNCAFVLAGLVLEARSGISFRRVIEREVFAAIGMTRSGFFAKDGIEPELAEGYADCPETEGEPARLRKNIYSFPPIGSPDAGACTTVHDLRRFFAALEGDGYLSPQSRSAMLAPVLAYSKLETGGERRMGFALEFDYAEDGVPIRFGKDGVNPGVAAIAMRYPRSKGFVALLANRDADVWSLCRELARAAGMDRGE
ncbi:MAG: serine hydrolase domain-containing protein [Spirochaetaceae bacterium]|nr:serine hydrolase domain-containing protein [Spirochaetaceae bacterium]